MVHLDIKIRDKLIYQLEFLLIEISHSITKTDSLNVLHCFFTKCDLHFKNT